MTDRRSFIKMIPAAALGMAAAPLAFGEAAKVAETDPTAIAIGYKANAKSVDKAKSPKYKAGQNCGNCMLYQGKAGSAVGACPIFGGKLVAAAGWCNSYAPKA